ncbi:MAG: DNA/RNA nuclease SfsA, partial [Desulfobacterales bacterium]
MSPSLHLTASRGLVWPELTSGTLLKRYKRFLADVELETGEIVTVHCPNTGSMKGCCEPGRKVYLSVHDNPKRKHIIELENLVDAGHRCMMFYFIQRMDAQVFRPADHIDPEYGRRLRRAAQNGLEVLAYDVRIDMQGIELNQN